MMYMLVVTYWYYAIPPEGFNPSPYIAMQNFISKQQCLKAKSLIDHSFANVGQINRALKQGYEQGSGSNAKIVFRSECIGQNP
jgi:hypothetical protein